MVNKLDSQFEEWCFELKVDKTYENIAVFKKQDASNILIALTVHGVFIFLSKVLSLTSRVVNKWPYMGK